jgi:hypothetical protein
MRRSVTHLASRATANSWLYKPRVEGKTWLLCSGRRCCCGWRLRVVARVVRRHAGNDVSTTDDAARNVMSESDPVHRHRRRCSRILVLSIGGCAFVAQRAAADGGARRLRRLAFVGLYRSVGNRGCAR